jgi:hypothetical protein
MALGLSHVVTAGAQVRYRLPGILRDLLSLPPTSRLRLDTMTEQQRDRPQIFQSALTYRDDRLAGRRGVDGGHHTCICMPAEGTERSSLRHPGNPWRHAFT